VTIHLSKTLQAYGVKLVVAAAALLAAMPSMSAAADLPPCADGRIVNYGALSLSDCAITGNATTGPGGGIENYGTLQLTNVLISDNHGESGGGIYNEGDLTLTNVVIRGNAADGTGGGIFNYRGAVFMHDVTIAGNSSGSGGGGLANLAGGSAIGVNVSVIANTAVAGDGGGILNDSSLCLTQGDDFNACFDRPVGGNSLLRDNHAGGNGGGIANTGSLAIGDSTVDRNRSEGGNGGGVWNGGGTTQLADVTISRNTTTGNGGGLFNGGFGSVCCAAIGTDYAFNLTIAANYAGGSGGGVFTNDLAYTGLASATIADNSTGGSGGGVYNDDASYAFTELKDTLLARNGLNCAGAIYSSDHNLDTGVSCGLIGPNDKSNVQNDLVGLDTLEANGGPVQGSAVAFDALMTLALAPSSPALDAGSETCPATDERGVTRPQLAACDIGAFEREPGGPVTVTASITAANKVYDTTASAVITTCTLTGVQAQDDVSCVASGGTFDTANAGTAKTVTATVTLNGTAAADYVLSSDTATATATITPAPATVTPNNAGKTYGAADPVLTGVLGGFFAVDHVTAAYSRTPGESVAGSPYQISAVLDPAGALANYSITYNTASFTITATAALSLTKTAKPTTYAYAGQTIVYTYIVQNTGGVIVSGPITISDDKLGSFQCGTAGSLVPGASVTCAKSYVIAAGDLGTVPTLPTGVTANVNTGAWVQGVMSTQDTTITSASGVPDGIYPGWCIQDHVPNDLHNKPGTLYSSIGGGLPSDVAGLPWNEINYVLNHKIRGAGRSDLQFFQDVQTAIWLLLGEQNPDFGKSAWALQMVADANANPSFTPGPDDTVAVIVYSDGMGTSSRSIQESIIEMKRFQQITNHATAAGSVGGTPVRSNTAEATVSQTANMAPVDAAAHGEQSTPKKSVATAAFSTNGGNRVLLAFVAADHTGGANTTVTSVSGAGLTWQLVVRANAQRGTAEIWRAYAPDALADVTVTAKLSQSVDSLLTVLALTGVDTSGVNGSGAIGSTAARSAASGAPSVTLTTTRANSWVVAVGNDWDNPVPRTVGAGQALVHQYMPPVGDSYWVQRLIGQTGPSGSTVTINDAAPATDRWNLAAVEVLVP
jgi:hypothetical protein